MPYKNKDDANAQKRRWRKDNDAYRATRRKEYHANKEKYTDRRVRSRAKIIVWFKEYRATLKCSRCPESDPCCIDFHHIHGKDKTVSKMAYTGSKEKILAEIAKCLILCSNCHRKEHYRLRQEIAY